MMPMHTNRDATKAYLKAQREFSAIIYRHDPLGVAPGAPDDEYDDWATKLLTQINKPGDEVEARHAITDYLEGAFDWHSDPQQKIEPLVSDLYDAWTRFQAARNS